MINQQTLQSLRALKLSGMADAFARQLEHPQTQRLSFEERFALLVDSEQTHRQNRRLQRLLNSARFKQKASVEEIDYQAMRGLNRSQVLSWSTATGFALARTCISPAPPARVKAGWPAPSARPPVDRASASATNAPAVCSTNCGSPAPTAATRRPCGCWPGSICSSLTILASSHLSMKNEK
ncbi:MAG: IstB-like ATP-binding domain-containing protein [Acidobacteriota bacterium]|nr:MAG: IstB-like ATP-binding domain-containing protein [Acidobacteriota bacterium]